ncbi:MAG: radical SAM protein [Deltaproteobacteria bacterium]|nr:radical SAM protein [Deltaproteobacteria bacterium]
MKNYIYGPVPSRRLGRSLGVDLVPYKVCSYDCIYCQLGRTREKTIELRPYIPAKKILDQLYLKLKTDICADYITLAGSGEPTLNSEIGAIIRGIKKKSSIPVAVLTNGSLLSKKAVRESITEADVIMPSLDAFDQKGFEAINRPHPDIKFENMIEGLIALGKEFSGEIWLEVFVLEGINASEKDAEQFRDLIKMVNPQKVHINTAVRPSAETFARQVSRKDLSFFCKCLGGNAEVITPFIDSQNHEQTQRDIEKDIFALISRRPCTLDDISSSLNVHRNEILKYITPFLKNHSIGITEKGNNIYYQSNLLDVH